MSKNLKRHPGSGQYVVMKVDTSRFMTLEGKNSCREASWADSFGAISLGSCSVATLRHPSNNGLRGDMEVLSLDYRKVGARVSSNKKLFTAS